MEVELRIEGNVGYNGSRTKDRRKLGMGVELKIGGNGVYNGSRTKDRRKWGLQ